MAVTNADLEAIRRRCDEATPGPWTSFVEGRDHTSGDSFIMVGEGTSRGADMYVTRDGERSVAADLDFIAESRQDVPRLLNEVVRLRALFGDCE